MSGLADLILGRPLATEEEQGERVGPLRGVSILGLDALASAAYGPEALLTILVPLGAQALVHVTGVMLVIVGLLVVVYLSYRQTIDAYPGGGGSYTVAKENLGKWPSLVAAAALSVDYVLNVAVAVSAGVGALVSAIPGLLPYTLWLCLALLLLLVLVNLRGVRATGAAWMVPTYAFVATLSIVLVFGGVKALAAGGHPEPVVPPPALPPATEGLTLWLLVRAFANGCTAMTGVEAVSNGVPIFRKPPERGARRTLGAIIAILVALLVGISLVARAYHVGATPPAQAGYESVLSQLTGAVIGRGWFYGVTIASIVSVLALSANTSFADFPRLCRLLAQDRYLPEPFEHRGRRLVFTHGIVVLALLSGVLLVVFQGVTDALIPLFAFGAFLAFTMSQSGMVEHWRRRRGNRLKLAMNGLGAVGTGVTCLVIVASKFVEGAWISILLAGLAVAMYAGMRRHDDRLKRAIHAADEPLSVAGTREPLVVVPMRGWDRVSIEALRFAMHLADDVVVAQVLTGDREVDDLTGRWKRLVAAPVRHAKKEPPRLVVLRSEYRRLFAPLVEMVDKLIEENPDRQVVVVVPELVDRAWFSFLVHPHTAALLREAFLLEGRPHLVVVSVPYYVCAGRVCIGRASSK
ncbi:MAG TPA: APC family permease [Polyangiaceae bacterium]